MVEVGDNVFVVPLYGQKDNLTVISGGGGGGITEGDYNTWTEKWSWEPTNVVYSNRIAFFIEESNDVFYLWWYANSPRKIRFGTYNISDHSAIFESPSDSDYTPYAPYVAGAGDYTFFSGCHSLEESILHSHQTYILLLRPDPSYYNNTIEIWKAGSLLWTRDIRDDTGEATAEPRATSLSLTGKYIMLFENTTNKLMLYEGSKV